LSNFVDFQTFAGVGKNAGEVKSEIIRKAIHSLIAISPFMAAINRPFTVLLLMAGILGYTLMENLRLAGINIPVVSSLTSMASRSRDFNRFVMGPVTLGFGALLALLLFPSPAATIGIYALAFGDSLAGLVGKFFGKRRPDFLYGKSIEGSFACFSAVFVSAYAVSGRTHIAFTAAFTAMVVEALPLEDYDNLVLPLTVALAVQFASVW
jgi:dolichol kinase